VTDNIIEMRPGISNLCLSLEPMGPSTPALPLTDLELQAATLEECRRYVLDVHARLYLHTPDEDFAAAVNLAKTVGTIMEAIAVARMANRALEIARQVDVACKRAIEAAERL